jgi:hypothetical protein
LITKNVRRDLLRYVTGKLSDDEHALFEERLLTDQEFTDEVAQHEQELIDDYAVGRLNSEESPAIRSWVEESSRRMQRVEMAKALLLRAPMKERRRHRTAYVLAAAACLLAAVGISLALTKGYIKRNSQLVATETLARSTPSLSGTTSLSPAISQKPEVLLLVAERVRGRQPLARYRISREAPLRMQILLSDDFVATDCTLEILSLYPRQRILLQQKNLKAQTKREQSYLEISLPAGSLPGGDYRALVNGGEKMLSADFAITSSQ